MHSELVTGGFESIETTKLCVHRYTTATLFAVREARRMTECHRYHQESTGERLDSYMSYPTSKISPFKNAWKEKKKTGVQPGGGAD